MNNRNTTNINYRPDIDGLRAIAVLLVLFYHANIALFSGGFIGVDIFFVISGYLITKIIVKDVNQGQFSIGQFYERRIRRILPALYVVIFFTVIGSYFLLLPKEFEEFGRSVIAATLSVSNILFWQETGYFNSGADLKPLLHTWSLGVEEQFYIFFPLFVIFICKYLPKLLVVSLIFVAIMSLILSFWATTNAMSANFYFAPTRAWELLLGSLIAFYKPEKQLRKVIAEVIGMIGIVTIIAPAILYDYSTNFPGLSATIPCLGAVMIIISGTHHHTLSRKILSTPISVFIGLISYSLYLWHWPIFVFTNYISTEGMTNFVTVTALCLSFLCAFLSWKYIETPFRTKKILQTSKKLLIVTVLSSALLIIVGSTIVLQKGIPDRFNNIDALSALKEKNSNPECADIPTHLYHQEKCRFGNTNKEQDDYLIWGDSHAHAMSPAIIKAAENYPNKAGALASNSGCPPLLNVELRHKADNKKCMSINTAIYDSISSNMTVFLVARWSYYSQRSSINKEGPVWIKDQKSQERSEKENLAVLERGLSYTIKTLQEKGANVIIVNTPPEFSKDAPNRYWQFDEILSLPKSKYEEHIKHVTPILENISIINEAPMVRTESFFCDEKKCISGKDNQLYFRDNDHLSPYGAEQISTLFDFAFKTQK